MTLNDRKYDVAVSFLSRDEPLAQQLYARLTEQMDVFEYSKRQEHLAGTNGLESLRDPFRSESRVVVVLFRQGWGETPWTRVEQSAITDRFLQEGWEFLLFVTLDDHDALPKWLPTTELRLSYPQYGLEQLLGAIKIRAQKLGSVVRQETSADRAKRFREESHARAERDLLLQHKGREAFQAEFATVVEELHAAIDAANQYLGDAPLEKGVESGVFTVRAKNVTVNIYTYATYPITDALVAIQEFDGRLLLPNERGMYRRDPKVISKTKFNFDYQAAYGWCWHTSGSPVYLASKGIAELVVKKALDLQERFERREIRKDRDEW
jgi:ElaB/YqjD/DUF883 family membrane-anchored ribosome-binding protein